LTISRVKVRIPAVKFGMLPEVMPRLLSLIEAKEREIGDYMTLIGRKEIF
jgi:hypothetical protein